MSALVLTAGEVDRAASLLARGRVVAIPTDTVYGLAAGCDDDAGIAALFAAKQRPERLPIAVLCASTEVARELADHWPAAAARLAQRYWPGPLTLVVDAPSHRATRLGAASGIGLRVPDDELCRELLGRTGPLAVTSANRHGSPPLTTAADVASGFGAEVAAVLDGGPRNGTVSTVLDVRTDELVVVRTGALAIDELRAAFSGA
jgi:tRNA threonylcarbamoyl adenosine modification protein (Sua5/YciO/YrdC/YwlC family)